MGLCEDGRFPIYAPRALASLGVAGDLAREALAWRALGRLHLSTGRIGEARGDLARAAEDLRTMGMMHWVAEAETLLATQN